MKKAVLFVALVVLVAVTASMVAAGINITWHLGADHPTYRKGGVLAVFEGAPFSITGMQASPWAESVDSYSYEADINQWWDRPDMLTGIAYDQGLDIGDTVYIVGGRKDGYTRTECYKMNRSGGNIVFTQIASLLEDTGFHGIGKVGTKIIVAGGNKARPGQEQITTTSTMDRVEYYDTANPQLGWRDYPRLPVHSRYAPCVCGLGNKLYVFGGAYRIDHPDGGSTYWRMNNAHVLDTTTGTWSDIATLPYGLSGAVAVPYNNRYIIILGGYYMESGTVGYDNRVLIYDTIEDTYTAQANTIPYGCNDMRAVIIGNKIYAVGGELLDSTHSYTDNHLKIGEVTLTVDITSPTGSVSINNGAAYTASTLITLTLSAIDDDSGVSQMRFSNDNSTWSTWETYTISKAWTLPDGSGTKTVYVQYKDNAGNISSSYQDTIGLDLTSPTGSILINGNAQYTNTTSVTLNLSATDTMSGVTNVRFSSNGTTWGIWQAYATSKPWAVSSGDTAKTVYVQYKDAMGNISSTYSDTIILDTTAPTGSVSINSGALWTKTTSVNLSLSASDGTGSGVYQMQFSNDNNIWSMFESYTASKLWTLTAISGTKTTYALFKDNAGNTSSVCLDTIGYDAAIPTSGTAVSPANANTIPIAVTYTGAGDTGGSGLKEVRLYYKKEQSGTWTDSTLTSTGASGTFNFTPGDGAGRYYFDLVAEDNAGNKSASASGDGDTSTQYSLAGGVQGNITLKDWTGTAEGMPAVIDIRDGTGTTLETVNVSLASDGGFNFGTSLIGAYTVVAKTGHWLAKAKPLTISGNSDPVNFTLTNGDCNGDNGIDEVDYAMLSNAWYQAVGDPAYNADADLNGDGGVDEIDYAILSNAWYTAGD